VLKVAEFFAGIGLAKIGLEEADLNVVWSNDISERKHSMFLENNSSRNEYAGYVVGDVASLKSDQLPKEADVAWVSFPCTDLSLAGGRKGIHHGESSAFWSFVSIIERLKEDKPKILALENVPGLAANRNGEDLFEVIGALNKLGYSVDILQIDAKRFVPQSRSRLFLVASEEVLTTSDSVHPLRPAALDKFFNDRDLRTHRAALPMPPALLKHGFSQLVKGAQESNLEWWSEKRVEAFKNSLTVVNSDRLRTLVNNSTESYRTSYRRMRNGLPRWEIRDEDISGCLRTASGGSSRQAVLKMGNGSLEIRWMSPREYAHLMGAPTYDYGSISPTHLYNGFGDGVCVPVVTWLASSYLKPWASELIRISSPHCTYDSTEKYISPAFGDAPDNRHLANI
jgi:DNA (cytosine-5)-methyltransferase 1